MSITIFLRVCLCFLVRLTKISQSGFWRSLNATARWWFSSTDSSLYLPSRSHSLYYHNDIGSAKPVHDGQLRAAVDQELVGEARVVHVVDGRGEDGGHHLQRREHALSNRKYFFGTDQIFFLCTHLQCGRVEKNVSGLSDVSAVHAVVIWNI